MGKLATPDWIKEGYNSKAEYEKSRQKAKPLANSSNPGQVKGINKKKKPDKKTFKIRECPKCGSYDVNVILTGEEGKGGGEWECKKCKWHGRNIEEEEITEEEFMKYLDEKGVDVA